MVSSVAPSPLNPETLQGLAARVAAASGPDPVLDLLIFAATTPDHTMMLDPGHGLRGSSFGSAAEFDLTKWAGRELEAVEYHQPPAYTASLDAALALVERVLSDKLSEILHAAWRALAFAHALHMRTWKPEVDGSYAPELARHVLSALLSALSEASR